MTHEWAIVPDTGRPKRQPASRFEVAPNPARQAARAASIAASAPWARRPPNSMSARPSAASTTRAALLAIMVWKRTVDSSAVSTSWASASGAATRTSGSPAKTGTPSSMASTSPVKRTRGRYSSKKPGPAPARAGTERR